MENKESIKKIYTEKIKQLKKHNELYYSKDNPSISIKWSLVIIRPISILQSH